MKMVKPMSNKGNGLNMGRVCNLGHFEMSLITLSMGKYLYLIITKNLNIFFLIKKCGDMLI